MSCAPALDVVDDVVVVVVFEVGVCASGKTGSLAVLSYSAHFGKSKKFVETIDISHKDTLARVGSTICIIHIQGE